MKYCVDEKGFTLMEVLLAALVLALLSLPIFYNSLQSANNYVSAEKYYTATLDAENIIAEVKSIMDSNYKALSGKDTDIETRFSDAVKDTKAVSSFAEVSDFGVDMGSLNLDMEKYSYQIYLKKLEDATVNILSAKGDTDAVSGSYKLEYGNLSVDKMPEVPIIVSGASFVSGSTITMNNTGLNTSVTGSGTDRLLTIEYTIDSVTTVTGPINISTYDMPLTDISGANNVRLLVKNYNASSVDINLYTDLNHSPAKDILVSYGNAGAIHVMTNQKALPVPENSYAIVVVVTDNAKDNRVLVQLTDVYSYVPK